MDAKEAPWVISKISAPRFTEGAKLRGTPGFTDKAFWETFKTTASSTLTVIIATKAEWMVEVTRIVADAPAWCVVSRPESGHTDTMAGLSEVKRKNPRGLTNFNW
jgi:hypothetical protein